MLALVLAVLQLGLWILLLLASAHLLRLALLCPRLPQTLYPLDDRAAVTVQLPLCNERHVAEQALRAAAALTWPRDRLQLQVLDDSDDDTSAIVDRVAAELRGRGHDIQVLRRGHRRGYKAGNLQHGLQHARGEFVAVLDADCVAPPDFLQQLVGALQVDEDRAFAQGRWSFVNEDQGLLCRVQALILNGLMLVEQPFLSQRGLPLQFNGSGGLWRRRALLEAGGWLVGDGSVAEDLDLSYRARLRGLRGVHLPQLAVETELPATMAAFRVQQQRWVRGGAQVLRGLWRGLRAGALPRSERMTMLMHLLRHARQPYLVLLLAWLPLTAFDVVVPWAPPLLSFLSFLSWPRVLGVVLGAVAAYYGVALRRLGRSPLAALWQAPLVLALSLGLCLSLSRAFLLGLLAGPAEFLRTPKQGQQGGKAGPPRASQLYRAPRDPLALFEAGLGGLYGAMVLGALWQGRGATALGLLLPALGLLWVGLSSASRRGP